MANIKQGWQGHFLQDFEPGDIYRCRFGRSVTKTEDIQFSLLTSNTDQVHFNREYGKRSGFDLGWDEIRLPNPVRPVTRSTPRQR